jgi:hypothetical protein
VDEAQQGAKDWLLWDDKLPGFGMKVTPSGAKVFVFQYRLGGRGAKVRRYTIGKMGRVTPDAARKLAEGLSLQVAQGIDPQSAKCLRTSPVNLRGHHSTSTNAARASKVSFTSWRAFAASSA